MPWANIGTPEDNGTMEADYRAGLKTLKQIASAFGLTEGAVRKRAKTQGWTRDLKTAISERANVVVRSRGIAHLPEAEIIEANAQVQVGVRLKQRDIIERKSNVVVQLLSEMEAVVGNRAMFERLGELMQAPDEKGKDQLNDIYRKIISTAGQADTLKKLVETYQMIVRLERESHGIIDTKNGAEAPSSITISF